MKECRSAEGLFRRYAEWAVYHAFSRYSCQYRQAEDLKFFLATQQFVIVFHRFAEAEAQIQDDVFYSRFPQTLQAYGEIVAYFKENIVVVRVLLHFVRCCGCVHEYVRHLQFCNGLEEFFIETSSGYVVDYLRSFCHACFADLAPNGVD